MRRIPIRGRTNTKLALAGLACLAAFLLVLGAATTAAQPTTYRIGVLAQDLQPGLLEDRLPALVDELLRLKVGVIVAVNTPAVRAAKNATSVVPIVIMRAADPVGQGLVASLARPGGNVTGLSFMPDELGAKGVQLLHEAAS